MKIYIAAPYAARTLAVEIATSLEDAGHIVTSEWIRGSLEINQSSVGPSLVSDEYDVQQHVQGDLMDVNQCDILLEVTGKYAQAFIPGMPDEWLYTGGRHVEFGYAIAKGKELHMLGEPENVFGRALATVHADLPQFLEYVTKTYITYQGEI